MVTMNLERGYLNKLEDEKKALKEAIEAEYKLLRSLQNKDLKLRAQNRMLYTGLGFILSSVTLAGMVLYSMVTAHSNVLAKDMVMLLFLFGLGFVIVWAIEQ